MIGSIIFYAVVTMCVAAPAINRIIYSSFQTTDIVIIVISLILASIFAFFTCVSIYEYRVEKKEQLTFAKLLSACKQDYVSPGFKETNFPLEPVTGDEDNYEVAEYFFSEWVCLKDGFNRLTELVTKREILLLTGSRRAMEWIAVHPNIQQHHPIILPLPVFILPPNMRMDCGYWVVPIFSRERKLDVCDFNLGATPDCGWLVLRKKNS